MIAARASVAVVEWLAQTAAEVSRVPAKPASATEAEVVASMMAAAAAAAQPRAPAPVPALAPAPVVDPVGCTVEQLDLVRTTC